MKIYCSVRIMQSQTKNGQQNRTPPSCGSGNQLNNNMKLKIQTTTDTTSASQPLYRTTAISQHPQLRTGDFAGAKFHCQHALADGNQHTGIREKMLEFSVMRLPAPSPYNNTRNNPNN